MSDSQSSILRVFTLTDAKPMQASKWLKCQLLLDAEEMQALFQSLGNFYIYLTGSIQNRGEGEISHENFLACYRQYVEALKSGELPEEELYRNLFSAVFTVSRDMLYAVSVSDEKILIRVEKPVVQLQSHRIDYSPFDQKFRSMVLGADSILWGIQFSYPQLFEDSITKDVLQIKNDPKAFPNTQFFYKLQHWVRHNTAPTPFIVEDKVFNVPIRLGKECFSWINRHPQLKKRGISVKYRGKNDERS